MAVYMGKWQSICLNRKGTGLASAKDISGSSRSLKLNSIWNNSNVKKAEFMPTFNIHTSLDMAALRHCVPDKEGGRLP